MAAQFEALGDFLDDWLELPVRGKDGQTRTYRIPSPPAEDGLRVEEITKAAARLFLNGVSPDEELLDDDEERDLYRLVLGSMHDEILADVSWTRFRHVALTTMVWIVQDRDSAAKYWSAGGDPSRLAPNRAARRQPKSQRSASAAASTTRSRGSTNGTKAGSRQRGRKGAGGAGRG
ncbi:MULTISPECIES: DUF7426 family protein [Streptomyces]|uniref:DUF7426 family protein n=1 Tax=Streptomyces TaxID=1883 RepID=UPI000765AC91|nr:MULTISPECIES: hypothetical protein [Streptomyces]MBE4783905.1 hypothetical protein [Streptomyces caniscabiei]MBE4791596.1 hypothetical protein [Streptomyces caniscabiei]MDX3009167.1 hypothetical protein [Streptomyces caniscabiei]MDX3831398.1 hypothetical protein [Streptomyces europaeiscabiei]